MTTKTISGTYASGYTLASQFDALSITGAGLVEGIGVRLPGYGVVINYGDLEGSVKGKSDGVALDEGGQVVNYGTISGYTGVRLHAKGTVVNSSYIGGSEDGIQLLAGGYVLNKKGQITGGAAGVDLADGGTVTNAAAGLIQGAQGVLSTAGATGLVNDGTIKATSGLFGRYGVQIADAASLYNNATGLIEGNGGVKLMGSLINLGTIMGLGVMEIYPSDGVQLTGAGSSVTNAASGAIYGGLGWYQGWIDSGSWPGGVALDLRSAGESVSNSGLIQGGVGAHATMYYSGNGGTGILVVAGAEIANSGTIAGGVPGNDTQGNYGTGGVGIATEAKSTITNAALIIGGAGVPNAGMVYGGAGGAGILLEAFGYVTNTGTIKGGVNGRARFGAAYGKHGDGIILSDGGYVTNGGTSHTNALISGYDVGLVASGGATIANFGTIAGTPTAVQFNAANDLLVAYGGSVFIGAVDGDGSALDLASGSGTISGVVNAGSADALVETVGGAQTTFNSFGTLTLGDGSQFTVAGSLVNFASVSQEGILGVGAAGAILNEAGATWTIANGLAPTGSAGTFTNDGLLTKTAGPALVHVGLDFFNIDPSVAGTVDIASGALDFTGAANGFVGTVTGAGTLILGGGSTSLGAGSSGLELTVAELEVEGATTQVTVNQALSYAGVWDQTAGSLSVASGDQLTLTGVGDSFTGTLTGAGTLDFGGGTDIFKTLSLSVAHMEIRGSAVTLEGAIDLTGVMTVTTPSLIVAAGGATLDSGGTLVLTDAATNTVQGASATARLTNDGKIQGAGQLGGGEMRLLNEAGGLIEGDYAVALVIDTGAQIIDNAGLIKSAGTGGVTVDSAMDNAGTLTAAKGTLTLDGAVTGAGKVLIEGGTADFGGAFTEAVTFTAAGGELELAKSQTYTGTITGFSKTGASSLDLEDIAFGAGTTTASFSGNTTSGVLTVTDGTHTAKIKLAGNYTTSTFTLSSDGAGGTKLVDPATTAAPHAFIAAMAGFGAGAAGPLAAGSEPRRSGAPALATPAPTT